MVAFKGGKNTGGKNIDYYDNPNYNPKDDGKSRGDKALSEAAENKAHYDYLMERKYGYNEPIEHEFISEAENESAYSEMKANEAKRATVSYFRGKDRERLNPGGISGAQINPKFSQPASLYTKLGKFGMSYDPVDPDTYYDQTFKLPDNVISEKSRTYDTGSFRVGGNWNEETVEFIKGDPMPKTVAGVNQELQAVKARTRDAAMEFRGMLFDYIDDIKAKTLDYADSEVAEHFNKTHEYNLGERRVPLTYLELQDKYFPDDASLKAAKNELRSMIGFTDEASDINRNYSTLSEYAETIIRNNMSSLPFPVGIDDGGTQVDDKITVKNYQKSLNAYSQWKAKKGIPKIVRLISKLS